MPRKIELNIAWFIYYCRSKFNMTKEEVLITTYGEMMDMITCYQIDQGLLDPKNTHKLSSKDPMAFANIK